MGWGFGPTKASKAPQVTDDLGPAPRHCVDGCACGCQQMGCGCTEARREREQREAYRVRPCTCDFDNRGCAHDELLEDPYAAPLV